MAAYKRMMVDGRHLEADEAVVLVELKGMEYCKLPTLAKSFDKRAKSFAGNVLFNDISTVPLLGEIPDWVRGKLLGERYWASNSLVSWGTDTWKYGAREWKNIDEGASRDKHVTALCSLARSVGALGGVGLNGHSAAIGSCCELTLAAASLSNTVRFVKDVVKKVVEE